MVVLVHWDKNEKNCRIYKNGILYNADVVILRDVQFVVIPEGRNMIRQAVEKGVKPFEAKFPHAFAMGTEVNEIYKNLNAGAKNFDYDVLENDGFTDLESKEIIHYANMIFLTKQGCKYIPKEQ